VFRLVRPVGEGWLVGSSAYVISRAIKVFSVSISAQAVRCDMQLPEGWEGSGFENLGPAGEGLVGGTDRGLLL